MTSPTSSWSRTSLRPSMGATMMPGSKRTAFAMKSWTRSYFTGRVYLHLTINLVSRGLRVRIPAARPLATKSRESAPFRTIKQLETKMRGLASRVDNIFSRSLLKLNITQRSQIVREANNFIRRTEGGCDLWRQKIWSSIQRFAWRPQRRRKARPYSESPR